MLDAKRIHELVEPLREWLGEDWPKSNHHPTVAGDIEFYRGHWFPGCGESTSPAFVEALFTVAIQRALRRRGCVVEFFHLEGRVDVFKYGEALGGASMDFQAATDLEAMCEAAKWVMEKEAPSA